MPAVPSAAAFDVDDFLALQEQKGLLRFITCGSVDDGKSTLIGRLLYETQLLFKDQLAALERDSRKFGTQGGGLDFALLVDGLAAEREQGITIDVAYRFFTTGRRRFIVADTPGHEQYTRNMATGASTADLAVILVDARKGLTLQTRRHSLIASTLGIRHVVVAVNKMDLVGWSQAAFAAIEADYRAFAAALPDSEITCIPVAALTGENVVVRSVAATWYRGPTLLNHLETVETGRPAADRPLRMPVQWVNRPSQDFRGYAGLITDGEVRPGMRVRILPSGQETRVRRIVTLDGDLDCATTSQSVTLTFASEIDVSRGDMVCGHAHPAHVADRLEARVLWLSEDPLTQGRTYHLRVGTQTVTAWVAALRNKIDLATLEPEPTDRLGVNEIGDCVLMLNRPVAFDSYVESRETGSFVLIDCESLNTVGMGMIADGRPPASASLSQAVDSEPSSNGALSPGRTAGSRERRRRSLMKAISWRATGTLDTTLLAFLFTGDLKISATIGVSEIITKITLYYLHERLWARIPVALAASIEPKAAGGIQAPHPVAERAR